MVLFHVLSSREADIVYAAVKDRSEKKICRDCRKS